LNLVIGVLGSGVMGTGIVQALLSSESVQSVLWLGRSSDATLSALKRLEVSMKKWARREGLGATEVTLWLSKLSLLGHEPQNLKACDLVIEAITEDLDKKKELLGQISQHIGSETLVASNTSSLSVTDLSMSVPNPANFLGLHFFNPAPIMELVEVIKGLQTSDEAMDKAMAIVHSLGKAPVVVVDSPGFIVNRMLIPMINEAAAILSEKVASEEYIDKAMKLGANHPMGPLALADLIGLDVCLSIMTSLFEETGDTKYRPNVILKQYVRAGFLGRKAKRGFYKY
jgi:3-hydroxybutyryl-CoA dehydrogenase